MSKPIFELDIINLYNKSLLEQELKQYNKIFSSSKFKNFIGKKCLAVLNTLMQTNLDNFNEHSVFDAKVEEYKKNCKYKIEGDYIVIYNQTILTQGEMTWVSEKTKQNYSDGISIAHIIEYGTGLLGTSTPEDDWLTNINNYKNSWSYKDPEDNIRHTKGIEGRYIFDKMMQVVEKHFSEWVDEFVGKEFKNG